MREVRFNTLMTITVALFSFQATRALATDIEFNGFGSAYLGQAFSQNLLPKNFNNTYADFTDFSLMGLNIAGKVSNDIGFASQLIAQGVTTSSTTSYNVSAQWVFLDYKPNDSIEVKLGRQLFPFFIASEYISVGYLLPYRAIPSVTYGLVPFNSIDGVSVGHTLKTSLGDLSAELFGGSPVIVLPSTAPPSSFSDLLGLSLTLDGNFYRFHMSGMVDFEQGQGGSGASAYSTGGHVQHYSIGYKLEKYNIVSWSELAFIYTPDSGSLPPQSFGVFGPTPGGTYLGWGQSGYVLLGYRLGKFLPRYTYAEGNFQGGLVDGNTTTHILGVNYQFEPQVIIKAEYQIDLVAPGRGSYVDTQSTANPTSSGSAFYAGVDFIF